MADQENADEKTVPPLFMIPDAAIQKWISIPSEQRVVVSLSRGSLDNWYFSMSSAIEAQTAALAAFANFSQGKQADAEEAFRQSHAFLIQALSQHRQFFAAIMASAEPCNGIENG